MNSGAKGHRPELAHRAARHVGYVHADVRLEPIRDLFVRDAVTMEPSVVRAESIQESLGESKKADIRKSSGTQAPLERQDEGFGASFIHEYLSPRRSAPQNPFTGQRDKMAELNGVEPSTS